jgi:hypothetical protein
MNLPGTILIEKLLGWLPVLGLISTSKWVVPEGFALKRITTDQPLIDHSSNEGSP